MQTTLLIALVFAAIVILGNVWYCKKNGQEINWNRGLIMGGVAAVLAILIGWLSDIV